MSETVSKALLDTKNSTVEETAKFISMIDKFFDALNVTDINCGKKQKKPLQSPCRKIDDFRIKVYLVEKYVYTQYSYKCIILIGKTQLTTIHLCSGVCALPETMGKECATKKRLLCAGKGYDAIGK